MNTTAKLLAAALSTAMIASAASATVVYEDTFDNDGLATNAKTGGGLASFTVFQNSFSDDGNLVSGTNTNAARRTVASTINAFDLSNGFTAEVHWEGTTNKTGYYDFSLTNAQLSSTMTSASEGIFTQFNGTSDGDGASASKGVGLAWGSFRGQDGLYYNNGDADGTSVTTVDAAGGGGAFGGSGTIEMELTVNADLSWSYSINDSVIDSGSDITGGGSLDLSSMYLNFYTQPTGTYSYAKITAIPEPSSLALLGLGGLLVARRRRG